MTIYNDIQTTLSGSSLDIPLSSVTYSNLVRTDSGDSKIVRNQLLPVIRWNILLEIIINEKPSPHCFCAEVIHQEISKSQSLTHSNYS